jgi:hypothetical protein
MAIQWVESVPSNASKVGNAPVDFKSVWTAISTGMAVEHYWPGAGGGSNASIGELKPGGTRTYVIDTATAPPTTSQLTARLAMTVTDAINKIKVQRLRVYESAGTYLVGTSWLDEHSNSCGSGYWLRQAGAVASVATGSATTLVTFSTPYLIAPTVFLTTSSESWAMCVTASTTTNFTSRYSSLANAASTATIYWESMGTASSGSF